MPSTTHDTVKILEHNARKSQHNRSSCRFEIVLAARNGYGHSIHTATGGYSPLRSFYALSEGIRREEGFECFGRKFIGT